MAEIEILRSDVSLKLPLPLMSSNIKAGFPSPADDFVEKSLDLNEYLIKHPAATFYVRVKGDSMINAGISEGDMLIVDRSLTCQHNNIIVAMLNGEFTVKTCEQINGKIRLMPANPAFKPIEISKDSDFEVWGVVTHIIKKAKNA